MPQLFNARCFMGSISYKWAHRSSVFMLITQRYHMSVVSGPKHAITICLSAMALNRGDNNEMSFKHIGGFAKAPGARQ